MQEKIFKLNITKSFLLEGTKKNRDIMGSLSGELSKCLFHRDDKEKIALAFEQDRCGR